MLFHCALSVVHSKISRVDGILIIDKPAGITSHDVVNRVRRILRIKRVGHTGTLDPFATGVMVVLVGRATRLAQFLDKDEKEYEAVVRFGFETDTGDVTGQTQNAECRMQNEEIADKFATTDWIKVLDQFCGDIEQTPPMYSAKKIGGKKLYEHARKGEVVERPRVQINISEIEIVGDTSIRDPQSAIRIRVVCSAGTYIRTLAEDIGRKVGTGAHLAELRRTRAGKFTIEQAMTLDELENGESVTAMLPMERAASHLRQIALTPDRVEKTKSGLSTRIADHAFEDGEAIRMVDAGGGLVAVGFYNKEENSVKPKVVLV